MRERMELVMASVHRRPAGIFLVLFLRLIGISSRLVVFQRAIFDLSVVGRGRG
jgi:hypothetical protein